MKKPRILIVDIETSPMLASVWAMWDQNVSLSQIKTDWVILSYAAKWYGEDKIFQEDLGGSKNFNDDSKLLKGIWKLMDEADIIVGQNSKSFDVKKLNARFIINGFKPPSSFRQIDTKQIAKSKFAFTSNKLEYLSEKLCKKYKKDKHAKFSGFELWSECLKGNKAAWKEMAHYNKMDVLSTEELWEVLRPWDSSFNPNLYSDDLTFVCSCGSSDMAKNGHAYTSLGKFQRFTCRSCGAEVRGSVNQLDKDKRKSLMRRV